MHQIESENVGKHNRIDGMIRDYDQRQKTVQKNNAKKGSQRTPTISRKMAGEAGTSNCSVKSVFCATHRAESLTRSTSRVCNHCHSWTTVPPASFTDEHADAQTK